MKKLDSSLTNMVLVLTLVAVIMGGILALVNNVTSGPIMQQKEKALADGIRAVMLSDQVEVAATDTIGGNIIYQVTENHSPIGAAVESQTMGFGGTLRLLVGFDTEGNIRGYQLLEHAETPGLGAKADVWFQKGQKGDIVGMNPATPLKVKKDGGEVDAITASTITSRAFLNAVNAAYASYQQATSKAITQTKEETL